MDSKTLNLLYNYNKGKKLSIYFKKYDTNYLCKKLKINKNQYNNIIKGKIKKNIHKRINNLICKKITSIIDIEKIDDKLITEFYIKNYKKKNIIIIMNKINNIISKRLIFLHKIWNNYSF